MPGRRTTLVGIIAAAFVMLLFQFWLPRTPELGISVNRFLRSPSDAPVAWLNITNGSGRDLWFIGEIYEPTSGRIICDYRQRTRAGWTNWTFNGHRSEETWRRVPQPFIYLLRAGGTGGLYVYLPTNDVPTQVWAWALVSNSTNKVLGSLETLFRRVGFRSRLQKIRIPWELSATNVPPARNNSNQVDLRGLANPLQQFDTFDGRTPLLPE